MDGYEFLNMSLKTINDRDGYLLVVSRGDGKALLLGTDNAINRLIAINAASPLEHVVRAYRTEHFAAIATEIAQRLRAFSDDCFGLWFYLDPSKLHDAIAEYDLGSGRRVRIGTLSIGDRVWVRDLGPGTLRRILPMGLHVALDEPKGQLAEVTARSSLVKPYLRLAA